MKLKPLVALGLSSLIAYKTYQHKDQLLTMLKEGKNEKDVIQLDLDKIKANLALISSETNKIQDISDNLNYKMRVFNTETQPLINQIKERMEKYQTSSDKE